MKIYLTKIIKDNQEKYMQLRSRGKLKNVFVLCLCDEISARG